MGAKIVPGVQSPWTCEAPALVQEDIPWGQSDVKEGYALVSTGAEDQISHFEERVLPAQAGLNMVVGVIPMGIIFVGIFTLPRKAHLKMKKIGKPYLKMPCPRGHQ